MSRIGDFKDICEGEEGRRDGTTKLLVVGAAIPESLLTKFV